MIRRKDGIAPLLSSYRVQEIDLQNLTPDQVKFILRNVRNGQLEDQDRLFRLMIDTWPRLRKAINEVAGAVAKLNIEVMPALELGEEQPKPEAQALADTVNRALISYIPRPGFWELGLEGAIRALVDAYIKGVSVLEILWHQQNGMISPRCYSPVPARFLAFPANSQEIDRLMLSPEGITMSKLEDFPQHRFIIGVWQQGGLHPIHAANLRALSKYWLASVYGLGWLMQYGQLFGIPWRHVETDGTDDAMTAAETMLDELGASGWAVTGPGVKLDLHNGVGGTGDSLPQSHMMDVADRACDILLLGQTLTSDNTGTGSRALGEVHQSVRADVLDSVASWVAATLTDQLVPAIIAHNFGQVPVEIMPYIRMTIPQAKDQKANAETIAILKGAGVAIPSRWAYEHLDIPIPTEGEELLGGAPVMPDDDEASDDNALFDEAEDDDPEPNLAGEEWTLEAARKGVDLQPTEEMAENARRALDVRRTKPESQRGMTAVGIARARDIANRTTLSPETVRRMVSFFARHEVDKAGESWDEQGKGWQAWNGWGGDAGAAWSKRKVAELEA